jgi:hypothetical protein
MDLLDGLDGDLYFEQPLSLEVEQLLKQAADIYPEQPAQSEIFLIQAQMHCTNSFDGVSRIVSLFLLSTSLSRCVKYW